MDANDHQGGAGLSGPAQTIIYLEDNDLVREGIATMLRFAGYRVVDFASSIDLLGRSDDLLIPMNGPVLAILDMRLKERCSGLDVFRQLKKRTPHLTGIFLSGESKVSEAIDAMKAGAFDFLLKPVGRTQLLEAVERCFKHLEIAVANRPGERHADIRMFSTLTQRENDVLLLVLKGQRGREIARNLAISERTVKMHRGNIMKKLGARSLAQLAALHQRYLLRHEPKSTANLN
jgi:two-component system, chemotaxis family, CheB/CheR fusion protein